MSLEGNTEKNAQGATRRSEALTLASLLTAVYVITDKMHTYMGDCPEQGYLFFQPFSTLTVGGVSLGRLVFVLLLVHVVRLQFGLSFINYDKSFRQVIDDAARKKKSRTEIGFRALLVISLGVLSHHVSTAGYWAVAVNLLFQGLVILSYNGLYWKEMYRDDPERGWNWFILAGDCVFLVFSIVCVVVGCFKVVPVLFSLVVALIAGAYAIIFAVEMSQYGKSSWLAIKDLYAALRRKV